MRKQRKHKYNAQKIQLDGYTFDSKLEAKYYEYLKGRWAKGEIQEISLQPKFELVPPFEKNGKRYRAITYVADFQVVMPNGEIEIVDIKGMETPDFKLKRKLFEYTQEHELKVIAYSKMDGGWIELDELKKRRKFRKKMKEMRLGGKA